MLDIANFEINLDQIDGKRNLLDSFDPSPKDEHHERLLIDDSDLMKEFLKARSVLHECGLDNSGVGFTDMPSCSNFNKYSSEQSHEDLKKYYRNLSSEEEKEL